MKVVYNVGNEKHEAKNASITINQVPEIVTDQDKSLIDYKSLGWKNGDIIVRKYVSRAEPNYFVFRNFGTTTEHDRVNVGTHIRFTKDRFSLVVIQRSIHPIMKKQIFKRRMIS